MIISIQYENQSTKFLVDIKQEAVDNIIACLLDDIKCIKWTDG